MVVDLDGFQQVKSMKNTRRNIFDNNMGVRENGNDPRQETGEIACRRVAKWTEATVGKFCQWTKMQ